MFEVLHFFFELDKLASYLPQLQNQLCVTINDSGENFCDPSKKAVAPSQ